MQHHQEFEPYKAILGWLTSRRSRVWRAGIAIFLAALLALKFWKKVCVHAYESGFDIVVESDWWEEIATCAVIVSSLLLIIIQERVLTRHLSSRPKLRKLLSKSLRDRTKFPAESIKLLESIAEPIVTAASLGLGHVSRPYHLGKPEVVQEFLSAVLAAHFVSQFEHMGDGGHVKDKKLLVTNFHSYAVCVQQLVNTAILHRGNRKVWCFSTWTQRMDRWFNYLNGRNEDRYDQGLRHWNDYLDYWEGKVSASEQVVIVERCILYRDDGDSVTKEAPVITESELKETLNRYLLTREQNNRLTRELMGTVEIDSLLIELEGDEKYRSLRDYIRTTIYPNNSDEKSHLIFPATLAGIELPKGRKLSRLRDVYFANFHKSVPGQPPENACRECKIVGHDWLGLKVVPDDIFMIGYYTEPEPPNTIALPEPLLAIGGDLELGGHGFAMEILSEDIDATRWNQVRSWVLARRVSSGSQALRS